MLPHFFEQAFISCEINAEGFTDNEGGQMLDNLHRSINYMRISLTDRCNLHCAYCRPAVVERLRHEEILRYEEIMRVARCASRLGITRFKITGGEPLMRKGAVGFIKELKALEGVEQVTLTTNGALLSPYIDELAACGLDGVNFSLDTLDAAAYHSLTGGSLAPILSNIEAAVGAGLRCKLNCVPLRGALRLPEQLAELVLYARELHLPLRFIGLMPLSCNTALRGYGEAELRSALASCGLTLTPAPDARLGNGPASYYRTQAGDLLGFIEPLEHKFCASCNRVRLTSVGALKGCLYSSEVCDLRALLRGGASDAELIEAMRRTIAAKPSAHAFEREAAGFAMNEIGG